MAPKLIQHEFEIGIDDHLFLIVKRKGRATISLDLMNMRNNNMPTHTDHQLKQALAKVLPTKLEWQTLRKEECLE